MGRVTKKRIAVLFHQRDKRADMSGYIVDHLAQFWREDGHDVRYLFGTAEHVDADLLFMHVNLSVVPDEFFAFAQCYPIVINGRLRDIRKSVISSNIVKPGTGATGPVVVKSDLNFGGAPERVMTSGWLERNSRAFRALTRAAARVAGRDRFTDWTSYRVYDSIDDVPRALLGRKDLVVERFLPELEDGLYHLRVHQLLGDAWTCTRLASPSPLFKAGMSVSAEPVEPHPEVERWRRELHLDYGKLDYLVHDGVPVLIDVNKTTGASQHMGDEKLLAMRRRLAEGLYSYFT